jgi:hypothetical protein
MSYETQELLDFVRQLPTGIAFCPIYAKGTSLKSGKISKGKTPLEMSHHQLMGPADVLLHIERQPEIFRAVGAFTGPRSGGLVILDVDANLAKLRKKWDETVETAPCVISTRGNACKYLFRIPEVLWGEVRGFGLSDTRAGYEVLWGRQGVLFGAYPGSSDGKAPEGRYILSGSLDEIPMAPSWLIAEMRDHKGRDIEDSGFIKNRKALDFSDRDPTEIVEIVQSALRVIPPQGIGSRDHWLKIGMAIHSELPGDEGLVLWSAWSSDDPEFADEWVSTNPCQEVWRSFRKGPVTLGTLFWMADQQMPGRLWLSEDLRKVVAEAEAVSAADSLPRFVDLIREVKQALQLDNPAEQKYELHKIAVKARMRDAFELEKMYVDQLQHEGQSEALTLDELMAMDFKRSFLIPDLLPQPSVILVYGSGGDGKSIAAWTLARHVAAGEPFVIRGQHVPVEQGRVLILNGDQPLSQVQNQIGEVGFPAGAPVTIRTDWSLQAYARFQRLMEEIQPKLVVIDSLIGCSGGRAFDENKSDFATPLYWLTRNNGVLFPGATIMIIHHANKTGGFRGTTAIRDAVDETWSLKQPSEKQLERVGANSRIITIEKSRSGRSGTSLLMRQESDLNFTLADWTEEIDPTQTSPSGIIDRVLQRIRVSYPQTKTRKDLAADPICGGSVEAIRKSLQRLEKRGLIEVVASEPNSEGGGALKVYRAVLARPRGEIGSSCPTTVNPSDTKDLGLGQGGGTEQSCPTFSDLGQPSPKTDTCPKQETLQENGSGLWDSSGTYPHARVREERKAAELEQLEQEAGWN